MRTLLIELPVYGVNFLLHSFVISLLMIAACLCFRDAARRAFIAMAGVLAITTLPWFTALHPVSFLPEKRNVPGLPSPDFAMNGWTILIEEPQPVPAAEASITAPQKAAPENFLTGKNTLLALWSTGSIIGWITIFMRNIRLARWIRSTRPLTGDEWHGLPKPPELTRERIRVTVLEMSPCATGLLRPVLVLPGFLLHPGCRQKLVWALRHETAHLRSGDTRMAALLSGCRAILWWNPAIWWLGHVWEQEREKACDAQAADGESDRTNYGRFLVEIAGKCGASPSGSVAMATRRPASRLKERLNSILQGKTVKPNSTFFNLTSSTCIVALGFLLSLSGIEKMPARENLTTAPDGREKIEEHAPVTPAAVHPPAKTDPENPFVPTQVKIDTILSLTREKLPQNGQTLDEAEREQLLRNIAAIPGNILFTAPSVVAGIRQASLIEIIREIPESVETIPRFLGLRIENNSGLEDGRIKLWMDCQLNFVPGTLENVNLPGGWPPPPPDRFDWTKLLTANARASARFRSGESFVVPFDGAEEGKFLTAIFRATAIDSTGRPTDDHGNLMMIKKPEPVWQDGEVKIRGAILTLPKDGNLPSYWFHFDAGLRLARSLYPSGHWEELRREATQAEGHEAWTTLGGATISSGSPAIPWPDFPVKIAVKPSDQSDCRLELTLPRQPGKPVSGIGHKGHLFGCDLEKDANGRRRLLLLALDGTE